MNECKECNYTDIAYWEQDKETGKATPIYWCERYREFCSEIQGCKSRQNGGIIIEAEKE